MNREQFSEIVRMLYAMNNEILCTTTISCTSAIEQTNSQTILTAGFTKTKGVEEKLLPRQETARSLPATILR